MAILRALLGAVLALALAAPAAAADEEDVAGINPRYLLMAPSGRAVSDGDFAGRFQLISFGYTFCPDVCPTTLAVMTQVLNLLGADAARVQPLFISIDPERDTAEVMRRYTEYFDPRILGLTGSPELVRRAADNYKVTYKKYFEPGVPADRYSVDHSTGMYLLGPDGGFIRKFAHALTAPEIAAKLREYLAATPEGGRRR